MDNEKNKVVQLSDHRSKDKRVNIREDAECNDIANPLVPTEVMEYMDQCLTDEDLESAMRVFSVLQTLGDKVTIDIDPFDITITTHHTPDGRIDAGIDYPEQVIKTSSTYQTATMNFTYDEKEYDHLEEFLQDVSYNLRRCMEALTYWAKGKLEKK